MDGLAALTIVIVIVVAAAIAYYYNLAKKGRRGETALQETRVEEAPVEEETPETAAPETFIELTEVKGIGPKWSERLKSAGVKSADELARCDSKDLAKKLGVSEKIVSRWIRNANEILAGR